MERTRATWTDERLDDFAHRVEAGLTRIDQELRAMRTDLGGRIDAQAARIDSLQRTMLQIGGGILVAIITLIATQI